MKRVAPLHSMLLVCLGLAAASGVIALPAVGETINPHEARVVETDGKGSPAAALERVLGQSDLKQAKLAVLNGSDLYVVELSSMRKRLLYRFNDYGEDDSASRPYWSADGKRIIVSYAGDAMIVDVASGKRQVVLKGKPVFEPMFWLDPKTGEECIVYKDAEGEHVWPEDMHIGSTWRFRPRSGRVERLADFPCDSGLSVDGRYLADTVGHAMLRDTSSSRTIMLNHGDIACNGSISPDRSNRLMHLIWPHTRFGIRNAYDRLVWQIHVPDSIEQWDNPRWSNHPDYCTAVAEKNGKRLIVVIEISSRRIVVLKSLKGEWYTPQLWLPSGAEAAKTPVTLLAGAKLHAFDKYNEMLLAATSYSELLTSLAQDGSVDARVVEDAIIKWARELLDEARFGREVPESEAALRELSALFKGHDIATRAAVVMKNASMRDRQVSAKLLDQVLSLAQTLKTPADTIPDYGDPRFFKANEKSLKQMVMIVNEMRDRYPTSEATARADSLATRLGMPMPGEAAETASIRVSATVVDVSKVPSPREIAPYRASIMFVKYRIDRVVEGVYTERFIIVAHWGMQDAKVLPMAAVKAGTQHELTLDPLEHHKELDRVHRAQDADDPELPAYWAVEVKEVEASKVKG